MGIAPNAGSVQHSGRAGTDSSTYPQSPVKKFRLSVPLNPAAASGEAAPAAAARVAPLRRKLADPLDEALRSAFNNARRGTIHYNPPHEMRVGEAQVITAQIAYPNQSGQTPRSGGALLGSGPVLSRSLQVSEEMRVILMSVEPGGFDIAGKDASTNGVQTVLPGSSVNWYWDVTPKRTGTLHLRLTASVVVRSGAEMRAEPFDTFDTSITVLVIPVPRYQHAWLWGWGHKDDLRWLLGLIPLEALRRWLRRTRGWKSLRANTKRRNVKQRN